MYYVFFFLFNIHIYIKITADVNAWKQSNVRKVEWRHSRFFFSSLIVCFSLGQIGFQFFSPKVLLVRKLKMHRNAVRKTTMCWDWQKLKKPSRQKMFLRARHDAILFYLFISCFNTFSKECNVVFSLIHGISVYCFGANQLAIQKILRLLLFQFLLL